MSYILDALKKSQSNADGSTVKIDPSASVRGISAAWIWVLGLVLALNVLTLVWFLFVNPKQEIQPQEKFAQRRATVEQAAVTAVQPSEPIAEPTPKPTPKPKAAPKPIRQYTLGELPTATQTQFSNFVFTSHIYTDDPSLCAIVINGQRLHNGDEFSDLVVYQITETGVIFEAITNEEIRRIEVNPFD